jgi:hypothetical protein
VDFCARKFKATGVYGTDDFERMEIGKSFDLIWVGALIIHLRAEGLSLRLRAYDG